MLFNTANNDILNKNLKLWRAVDRFNLWTRVVLSPEEATAFQKWALRNHLEYSILVRRYKQEGADEDGRIELLQDVLDLTNRMLTQEALLRRDRLKSTTAALYHSDDLPSEGSASGDNGPRDSLMPMSRFPVPGAAPSGEREPGRIATSPKEKRKLGYFPGAIGKGRPRSVSGDSGTRVRSIFFSQKNGPTQGEG